MSNLSFVLSGGSTNRNPNTSLGGDPSSTSISNNRLNNLFDDVSETEAEDGMVDYRCLYVFNDADFSLFDLKIWIFSDFDEGASIELGIASRDEIQRITITGEPADGSMLLSYDGVNLTSNYNADVGTWATNLQTAINNMEKNGEKIFRNIVVTAQVTSSATIFDLQFTERDGKRTHDLFEATSNFVPSCTIAVTKLQTGAPINTIAPTISVETTPPGQVGFYAPLVTSPIEFSYLAPGDGFPIWIKRTVTANTGATPEDGVTIRISSSSLEQ